MSAALISALTKQLAALRDGQEFMVVELASEGIRIWRIRRESNGTPRCHHWDPKPWLALGVNGAFEAELGDVVPLDSGSPIILIRTFADSGPRADDAFRLLSADTRVESAFVCEEELRLLLARVLANDRLTQFYELVVITQSKSGRSELATHKLFSPGSQRGAKHTVNLRCEATDDNGTAFAVVAFARDGSLRLVSVKSVRLPPGSYPVTIELRRPGRVSFNGLDAEFRVEPRSWSELIDAVPERLELRPTAHLICLVETSGDADAVSLRLGNAEQLIQALPGAQVSLLSYGPHQVARDLEVPLEIAAWAQPASAALTELDKLRSRGAWPLGYPQAAQLECALKAVADRLPGKNEHAGRVDRRVAIVTIGARPAFPPSRDRVSKRIPCPERHNWLVALERIRRHGPAVACGAVIDGNADEDIWASLGRDVLVPVSGGAVFDVRTFLARLGLVSSSGASVPFPLLEPEGA